MSEQENVQTVRKAYDAFARGDIATLMEMVHEDVEWEKPGDSKIIPHAGKRRGRDAVKEFFMLVGETKRFKNLRRMNFSRRATAWRRPRLTPGACVRPENLSRAKSRTSSPYATANSQASANTTTRRNQSKPTLNKKWTAVSG